MRHDLVSSQGKEKKEKQKKKEQGPGHQHCIGQNTRPQKVPSRATTHIASSSSPVWSHTHTHTRKSLSRSNRYVSSTPPICSLCHPMAPLHPTDTKAHMDGK